MSTRNRLSSSFIGNLEYIVAIGMLFRGVFLSELPIIQVWSWLSFFIMMHALEYPTPRSIRRKRATLSIEMVWWVSVINIPNFSQWVAGHIMMQFVFLFGCLANYLVILLRHPRKVSPLNG